MNQLGRMVVLVHDYDIASRYYQDVFGLNVIVDMQADHLRFVHLGFPDAPSVGLWLMLAVTDEQKARVGNQTGGEPIGVIYTDRLTENVARLKQKGVRFVQEPVKDDSSLYAQFADIYGNIFVLVELTL